MVNSINMNAPANQALQSLNTASEQVESSQSRISTGLKVDSAKDDGARWSIAQNMRSKISDWQVVSESVNRGQSILDVAASGAAEIGDLLNQLQAKALSYSDVSLDTISRSSLQTDMEALIQQIDRTANNSDFQGVNLLNHPVNVVTPIDLAPPAPFSNAPSIGWYWYVGLPNQHGTISYTFSQPASVSASNPINYSASSASESILSGLPLNAPANPTISFGWDGGMTNLQLYANPTTTITSATFTPDGPVANPVQITSDPNGGKTTLISYDLTQTGLMLNALDWSDPQSVISAIDGALATATNASMTIGTQQNSLTTSQQTVKAAQDNLQTGVSNMVDADIGAESARLQAAQSKQQLAVKALSIANTAPQWILSLFR